MAENLPLGYAVWIEHSDGGDYYTRVKFILERQPAAFEVCPVCHRGDLALIGHLLQTGLLDDHIYAVSRCGSCCALTVFSYHVGADRRILPEKKECNNASV